MVDWISDLLIFSAGIAAGILLMLMQPVLSAARQRRTKLLAARERILANIKEQHEKEILDEALRTTEAIRGELDKTRDTLRKTLLTVSEAGDGPSVGSVDLSAPGAKKQTS